MIQYALKCKMGHTFESWFQSADAFDKLSKAGMVVCSVCGCAEVDKAIMAPRVRPARTAASPDAKDDGNSNEPPQPGPLSAPASQAEQALRAIQRKLEESADYVGADFAQEARAIHEGEGPARLIYGEAAHEDAKALIEDGVPVTPLPFALNRKVN